MVMRCYALFLIIILHCSSSLAQNTRQQSNVPARWMDALQSTPERLQALFQKQAEKQLHKLQKKEARLQLALQRKDPAAAKAIFGNLDSVYQQLQDTLRHSSATNNARNNVYIGQLDSLRTALRFLQQNPQAGMMNNCLQETLQSYEQLQNRLNSTGYISTMIQNRQQLLQDQLSRFGFTKQLRALREQAFYYRAKMQALRNDIEDPSRYEALLLSNLRKLPAFQNFFRQHADLASIFRISGENGPPAVNVPGLQTRALLTADLQQRLNIIPPSAQALQQNVSPAQSAMNDLRNRFNNLKNGNDDPSMPDFKPNGQKTKSFAKRLQFGFNMQSARSDQYFPSTTDLGLSLGFRVSDRSIAGLGASYKLGLGKDFRHVELSHEGAGLRLFSDIKLKGSLWISGGYEMNYQSRFSSPEVLWNYKQWTRSALLGISRKVGLSGKFNSNLQLLYDFLWKERVPAVRPLVFRIGYSLK